MCGIAGIVWTDRSKPAPTAQVRRMNACNLRRGPDGEGVWAAEGASLGHRRLAIIDLSPLGSQPMTTEDDGVAVVHNGEIYNFRELRGELESEGARFRSNSDTEVLLHGYLRWGIEGLLERVDGMFAFGLFDRAEGHAFLCRDRFGKKPLYYRADPQGLSFCSSARGLWEIGGPLSLDYQSLDHFLHEQVVPQPRTIWRELRQVAPAHYLQFEQGTGRIAERTYWRLPPAPAGALDRPSDDAVLQALEAAVRRRTVADVPIGALLSGGVDSGLVVALLARSGSHPVLTFTVGFREQGFDEAPRARAVARRYGTSHTEIYLGEIEEAVVAPVLDAYEEPFADSSAIPTYLVCREVRRHVKVVLSGDGGDELFGYPAYADTYLAEQHLRRHPTPLGRLVARLRGKAGRTLFGRGEFAGYLQGIAAMKGAARLHRTLGFRRPARQYLYTMHPLVRVGFAEDYLQERWNDNSGGSLADTLARACLQTRLLNDYLVKVDRGSMAHALELRSPFLDRALAELAFSLPPAVKYEGGVAKAPLKRLADRLVDPDIGGRPKAGFSVPLDSWLRGPLREPMRDLLEGPEVHRRGIFDEREVRALVGRHLTGVSHEGQRLWTLMCFEHWCRRYLDASPPSVGA